MRKIDIEKSRDYYKKCLNSALRLNEIMTKRFCELGDHLQKRINELESKIKKLKEA